MKDLISYSGCLVIPQIISCLLFFFFNYGVSLVYFPVVNFHTPVFQEFLEPADFSAHIIKSKFIISLFQLTETFFYRNCQRVDHFLNMPIKASK